MIRIFLGVFSVCVLFFLIFSLNITSASEVTAATYSPVSREVYIPILVVDVEGDTSSAPYAINMQEQAKAGLNFMASNATIRDATVTTLEANPFEDPFQKEKNYIFLHRDFIAEEYLWFFCNGLFVYTYENNNIIHEFRYGHLTQEQANNICKIYDRYNLKDSEEQYTAESINGVIVELDRFTLVIYVNGIYKKIITDSQSQPCNMESITKLLYKSIENKGYTIGGIFIKSKSLDKIYNTSNGVMTQGEYFEYKGRKFYDINELNNLSPQIKKSLEHLNYFYLIDQNAVEKIKPFFDHRSKNNQILTRYKDKFYAIELFKTEQNNDELSEPYKR